MIQELRKITNNKRRILSANLFFFPPTGHTGETLLKTRECNCILPAGIKQTNAAGWLLIRAFPLLGVVALKWEMKRQTCAAVTFHLLGKLWQSQMGYLMRAQRRHEPSRRKTYANGKKRRAKNKYINEELKGQHKNPGTSKTEKHNDDVTGTLRQLAAEPGFPARCVQTCAREGVRWII